MSGFFEYLEVFWDRVENPDAFPFTLSAVKSMGRLALNPRCTFFIGENGTGKSTILEAMAIRVGFSAEGGTKDHRVKTHDSHSELFDYLIVKRGEEKPGDTFFLRAETLYNVASYLEAAEEFGAPRLPSLHKRSHGEAFLAILNGMKGCGLYLMDEPESALSPQRQLSFLIKMDELIRDDSQFVIATHSPIILAYPNATIYEFGGEGIHQVAYEDTEHYQITKDFLNAHSSFLRHIVQS